MNKTTKKTEKPAASKQEKVKSKSEEEPVSKPKLKKTQKEKKKDKENGVKKNQNAYMFFINDVRAKYTKERPDLKGKEMTTVYYSLIQFLATQWKALDDNAKKKYQDMADKDKERYKKEMESSGLTNKKSDKSDKKKPSSKFELIQKILKRVGLRNPKVIIAKKKAMKIQIKLCL